LSDFNKPCIFFDIFSTNTEDSNCTKIRPVAAELFHANGRIDGGKNGRTDGQTRRS